MIRRAIAITHIALDLGRVERATYHQDGRRRETDTDHTVMLSLLVADLAQLHTLRDRVDLGRLLAFALVHDVVEAYAGDTVSFALTAEQRQHKADRESKALDRLRLELGAGSWLVETIEAYERQDTLEARLVNYVDKIAPKLTHALSHGQTWADLGISARDAAAQHIEQGARLAARSPDLPELAELFEAAHCLAIESYLARPEVTPPIPDLYLLEVGEERRRGRGRWWCANGQGYTDRLDRAGLYPPDDHRVRDAAFTEGRCVARRLADVLEELTSPADALLKRALAVTP